MIYFREGGEDGQMVVLCGGQGEGERNTNSYAMIMFCVIVGAVYM